MIPPHRARSTHSPAPGDGTPDRISRTDALVLRVSPFSRTSHVVTWLSPDFGRMATVIKGACRPKSPFLGQYDSFYTCELLFYTRDRGGLHIARECCPLNARPQLRSDWKAFACASYICDLALRVAAAGARQAELFAAAEASLDHLAVHGAGLAVVHWFELRLLDTQGLAPRLAQCTSCGAAAEGRGACRFSPEQGGVLCPACAAGDGSAAQPVEADTLAILRHWQQSRSPRAAGRAQCTPEQLLALRRLLGTFLQFHIDVAPACRRIALDLASAGRAQERKQVS